MRVGFFTHVKDDGDVRRAHRDTIELAVTAEEAGLDSFWVAQHHGGAAGSVMPSPLVLLAAVAERTSRIELGVAAIVAPGPTCRRRPRSSTTTTSDIAAPSPCSTSCSPSSAVPYPVVRP